MCRLLSAGAPTTSVVQRTTTLIQRLGHFIEHIDRSERNVVALVVRISPLTRVLPLGIISKQHKRVRTSLFGTRDEQSLKRTLYRRPHLHITRWNHISEAGRSL